MTQMGPHNDYSDDSGESGAMVPFDAYSAGEMALRMADLKGRMGVVQEFFRDVMVAGQDYGVIPGTEKPALLKPGAEKLAELYGYAPVVKSVDETVGDGGFYETRVTMALVSRKTGQTVAEGIGSANTFEGRYRWRWVYEDKLPKGVDRSALVKRSGRGRDGREWAQYRIENDDMYALYNTVLKMAKKRALVDVVLSATRSSGIFTQDSEAFERWKDEAVDEGDGGGGGKARAESKAPPPRGSARRSAPAQDNTPSETVREEPAISRFWRDVRAAGIEREAVVEQLGHDRFEELDDDSLGELLIQLREKFPQKGFGV